MIFFNNNWTININRKLSVPIDYNPMLRELYREIIKPYQEIIKPYREIIKPYREIIILYRETIKLYRDIIMFLQRNHNNCILREIQSVPRKHHIVPRSHQIIPRNHHKNGKHVKGRKQTLGKKRKRKNIYKG